MRGGKREGSGRPLQADEARQSRTLRFTQSIWEMIDNKAIRRGFVKKGRAQRAQYLEMLVRGDKEEK